MIANTGAGGLRVIASGSATIQGGKAVTINLPSRAAFVISDIATVLPGAEDNSGNQYVALDESGITVVFTNDGAASYTATHYYLAVG